MKQLSDGLRTHQDNWIRALTRELEIETPSYRESFPDSRKLDSGHYDFKLMIWRRERKPYWYVAAPQKAWEGESINSECIYAKKARYELTGRVFYDCRNGPSKEFAYEYEFKGVE